VHLADEDGAEFELIFEGGWVVDGAGAPPIRASVAVRGDRVYVLRGETEGRSAARRVQIDGNVICPGFIDMHAHSGLTLLTDPDHEAKLRQGVTTEVIGVDGNSYAPFPTQGDFQDFAILNSGLDGDPPAGWWSSVDEYLTALDGAAVNVVYLVGNSPLRVGGMGWQDRVATKEELTKMRALVRESMEEGAFGVTTGLDYPPGSYAATEELVELCEEAATLGGFYHAHVRYALGDRHLDPFREAFDIGRRSGIPVHLTHFYQRETTPGSAHQMLALVEEARAEGLDVTFDSYPFPYGSSKLTIMLPQWVLDGGVEKARSVLGSDEGRRQLRKEIRPRGGAWGETWLTNLSTPRYRRFDGWSVADIAHDLESDPVDVVLDLLVAENFAVTFVAIAAKSSTLTEFVGHPLGMIGSDALLIGDHPSPRSYGTFPRFLSEYVREERRLSVEEAVRKMTSLPAQRLGLPDRGLLRDGFIADLVVFNLETIDTATSRVDPKQYPTGVEWVVVNGKVAVESERPTGAAAGRALRRSQ
jgi:N-acyl-D-amino-acid deacylase